MKKALLAALLVMVISSWCLAQTDSLPAPTAEDTIKDAPVAIKQAEGTDKKWILGFEATSLDLKALPGTVFLQRKISPKVFVGAGFSFDYYNYNPGEDYDADDSTRYNQEEKRWSFSVTPEVGYMALNARDLTGGVSVKLSLNRSGNTSFSESRYERYYYTYSTYESEDNNFSYSLTVPVFVEKQFKIKKYPVAVGLTNNFIGLSGGWRKAQSRQTYESYWSPAIDVDEDERTSKMPVTFSLDNPFQGRIGLVFKLYL